MAISYVFVAIIGKILRRAGRFLLSLIQHFGVGPVSFRFDLCQRQSCGNIPEKKNSMFSYLALGTASGGANDSEVASEQPAVDIEAPGQDRRGHILFGETLDLGNG